MMVPMAEVAEDASSYATFEFPSPEQAERFAAEASLDYEVTRSHRVVDVCVRAVDGAAEVEESLVMLAEQFMGEVQS